MSSHSGSVTVCRLFCLTLFLFAEFGTVAPRKFFFQFGTVVICSDFLSLTSLLYAGLSHVGSAAVCVVFVIFFFFIISGTL